MIEISNLRKYYTGGGIVRLEADINFIDMNSPYSLKTIYFDTDKENADMLDDESYNAFVLVPLFVAMFHKQDLHICGKISKRLYQNVKWYIWKIFCDFSPSLSPVNFTVDGFTDPKQPGNIIGTGISSGVDSLTTLYDKFICEHDLSYKINTLFYFSHDWKNYLNIPLESFNNTKGKISAISYFNYDLENNSMFSSAQSMFKTLFENNQRIAKELNLSCYPLETNLPVFNIEISKLRGNYIAMSYIALYSCILALGKKISKYYIASALTYEQEKIHRKASRDKDMSEFCEMYLVPLISTEQTELIIDGCQYRRVDKLKRIVDWEITKKYLNVCWHNSSDGSNCGTCGKCLRTLLALEIIGKLDNYSSLFDIENYRNLSLQYKRRCIKNYKKTPFETELVNFAKENNFPMPTVDTDKK